MEIETPRVCVCLCVSVCVSKLQAGVVGRGCEIEIPFFFPVSGDG